MGSVPVISTSRLSESRLNAMAVVSKRRQANINRIKRLLNAAYRPSSAGDNIGIVFVYRASFNHLIVIKIIRLA